MDASRGEMKIHEILEKSGLTYRMEYSFEGLNSSNGKPLRFDFAVFDDVFEGRQVCGAQVALADAAVKLVASALGTAVDGEVLEAGGGDERIAHIVLGPRMLQAFHAGAAHQGGEAGVLAVGLHAASPAGVAEDVDVGGEEGEALVVAGAAGVLRHVVFVARFVGDEGEHEFHARGVEGGGEGYGHGIDGGQAGASHAVQRLVPPAVGGKAHMRDGWILVHHEGELLFEREFLYKPFHPPIKAFRGVLPGVLLGPNG